MRTKASIRGHPIHAMLVPIPLGALPTAFVFDAIALFAPDRSWHVAALVATIVGAGGILIAIVPGLIDYAASVPKRGAVHGLARAHMGLGLGLAGYFALVALGRWLALDAANGWTPWILAGASLVGILGLTVQGFLGGELRARHRIGVEPGPEPTAAVTTQAIEPPPKPRSHPGGPPKGGGAPGAP